MTVSNDIPNRLVINRSVYEQFFLYTKLHAREEWGGLLIGYQEGDVFYARSAVLPPQKNQSGVFCLFQKEIFPIVTKNLIKLSNTLDDRAFDRYTVGSWIHTHPGLTVFFSATDVSTYQYLSSLAPNMTAVVLDPINDQILAVNSYKGETYGFTQIPVHVDSSEMSSFDSEYTVLEKFQQVIESSDSAAELGVKEPVRVFIPVPDNNLTLLKMQMRLEYCEQQLKKVSIQPTISEYIGDLKKELEPYIKAAGYESEMLTVPVLYKVTKKSFLVGIQEEGVLKARHLFWSTIKSAIIEVHSANLLSMILLTGTLKRRKHHFFLYTSDFQEFQECVIEYLPRTVIEAKPLKIKSKKKKGESKKSDQLKTEAGTGQEDYLHGETETDEENI